MLMPEAREQIVDYGKRMQAERLTAGTSGNLSIYDSTTGYMAISPSGIDYNSTKSADIVIMTLDGIVVEGDKKPSSEHDLHAGVYQVRPDAGAVVHMHSTYCTTLACLHVPLKAIHYAIADAGVAELPSAAYHTFGTKELADAVKKGLEGNRSKAILLQNHGIVVCGSDMKSAFGLAKTCEWTAEIQWRCMCAGTPHYLSDEEMDRALEGFASYGQAKPGANSGGYNG